MKSPVLLITDSPELCRHIKELLKDDLVVCRAPSDAAEFCRNHQVRVVLVAEELSGRSALALFAELQAENPELVGLLIAMDHKSSMPCLAAMESGFSGLLAYPLDGDHLQHRVNRAMEAAALREENARLRALLPLYGLGEKFLSSTTQEEVLECLLQVVSEQTVAQSLSVMLYNEQEGCLRIAASRGIDEELVRTICIRPGDKIAGWVFAEKKPVILNRETQDNSPFADLLKRPEIVSAVSFPMIIREQILGVLNISLTDSDIRFADSDIELLGILCAQAALALENVRSMASREEETRLKTLLEQYVAPEVAELLLASDADIATGLGEIKRVTVFFADIRNFTGIVQQVSLEVLHDFLNEFFQVFTETIFQHRGTVDKFMGDAVLAVFGAPIELENANVTAVRTALAIRKGFAELKQHWRSKNSFFASIDLGIGITCGDMFLGNVGSARRLDYTVIGTDVNIAQRLATVSSSCTIYITERVRQDLDDHQITVTDVGRMGLRGVQKPVRLFSVHEQGKI